MAVSFSAPLAAAIERVVQTLGAGYKTAHGFLENPVYNYIYGGAGLPALSNFNIVE